MNEQRDTLPGKSTPTDTAGSIYRNWREKFAQPMLIGTLIIGLLALVAAVRSALSSGNYLLSGIFIAAYLFVAAVTFVPFPYWLRMGVFVFIIYALGLSELFSTGILGDGVFFFLAFIALTTMMFSPREGMAAVAVSLLTFLTIAWLTLSDQIAPFTANALPGSTADWLSASFLLVLFGGAIILGLRQLRLEFLDAQGQTAGAMKQIENERTLLEQRVSERTVQLRTVNDVGRAISAILDPDALVSQVVNLITDQFGYYYTAIFLLEPDGQWARLQDATGEAGRVLRESHHRLEIGGRSMVGIAISTGRPRIALESGDQAARFENPLLPYTRSEIALPLAVGERVLGALDVQSTQQNAFGPQDIETLQGMANQVAIALENARLFQEAQQSLAEMQSIQRQYLLGSWKSLAQEGSLEYQLGEIDPLEESSEINVDVSIRDQIIGQISMAGDSEWTPEQRGLIEAVATQAALALENARLVEESQSAAAREHIVADITSKVWSSITVDGILQTAIRELGRVLNVSEATIELKPEE
jgi:GAF domain-containing protein